MKEVEVSNNPYVLGSEGKKEWNNRYMNMAKSIKNWQIACLCSFITSIVLAVVVTILATTSRIQPYVIDTNHGLPYAIQPLARTSSHSNEIVNFAVNQFIVNARTILNDPGAEKILLDKVYAFAGNDAIRILHDYYQAHNPLQNTDKNTVEVSIINSMPLGKDMWQVEWGETRRNPDGSIVSQTRWMADIAYQFGKANSKFINDNPFGLYITDLTWSQNVGV